MPRFTQDLPSNRADYTFGDLIYFHLFRQGTRPKGPNAPWEMDAICSLTGIGEKVLRNWMSGQNLPNNFPSALSNALFGSGPEWNEARTELLTKFEEGWARRRKARAAPTKAVDTPGDVDRGQEPAPSPEESGKDANSRPQTTRSVVTAPSGSGAKPPAVPGGHEIPRGDASAPRKSGRVALLALAAVLLLSAGGITAWRLGLMAPLDAAKPPVPPPEVTPPGPGPTPPPERTGTARFEGTWRVTTIPKNTPTCDNPGRTMVIKIDATGRITDMCHWRRGEPACGPSLAGTIRNRTVSATGAFDFSYFVIDHENRLLGTLRDKTGDGELKAWRGGAPTPCPAGQFEAERIN